MELNIFETLEAEVALASESNESRNIALEVERYEEINGEMCVIGIDMLTGKQTQVALYEDKGADGRSYPRTSLDVRADGGTNRHIPAGGIMILERAYEQPESTDDMVIAKAGWTHTGTSSFEDGMYFSKFMTVQLIPAKHGKKCGAFVEWVGNSEEETRLCQTMEDVKKGVTELIVDSDIDSIRPHVHVRLIDTGSSKSMVLADLVRHNGNASNNFARESVEAYINRVFNQPQSGDKFVKIIQGLFDRFNGTLPPQYKMELLRGGSMPMTNNRKAKLFDKNGQIPMLKGDGGKPVGQVLKDLFSVGNEGKRDTPMFTQGHITLKNSLKHEGVMFLSYANPVKSYAEFVELKDIPSVNFHPEPANVVFKDATMESEPEPDDELGASAAEIAEITQSVSDSVARAQEGSTKEQSARSMKV
ncbi:hypothetical protein [Aeromonas veronii]|uniref:Uncharacterized protein n=1 Tax=Aeromonas veronii TaxID=654 RepID=A0A4S5CDR2_AERVE|nr:hypothetical protein [Aeromonas veronii]THJ43720.1 hypothetical protein E8Q35_15560 [Aeromonas veronii]